MATDNAVAAEQKASAVYLYGLVLVAAVGGFVWGYDISLISGAIVFLQEEFALTPFWIGLVAGSTMLGCPVGPLAGVWLADTLGRKRTMILAATLFVLSTAGSALAGGMIQFSFWRFVGGMGCGLASAVSPMYIAEIAPARLRGRMVMVNQLAIVVGLSLSVFVTYLLSYGAHWRWMFATQGLPIICFIAGLLAIPESPRWLAAVGRRAEALRILTRINGATQAHQEMQEIQTELDEESGGFGELFRPGVRLALFIGTVLMIFSDFNGATVILTYTPTLFLKAGIATAPDAILNSVYICGWITLCTVIAFWLIRTFSRRSILIWGSIGMSVGNLLMFLAYNYHLPMGFILAAMLVPTGAFTLTLAPLSWVVLSEIFPNRVRGKAMSLATGIFFAVEYGDTNLFPMLLDWSEKGFGHPGGAFLIFVVSCAACALFVWILLPETKDKTLEEIGEFWLKRDRARVGPLGEQLARTG